MARIDEHGPHRRVGHLMDGAGAAGRAAHLLVASEDPVEQLVIGGTLESLGYTFEAVDNGFEALAVLRRSLFDAVLMDCEMLEMDGYQATRAIRAGASGSRGIPVIAMTASDVEHVREKCLAAGMDAVIEKPVHAHALTSTLERWVTVVRADAPHGATTVVRGDVLDRARLAELHTLTVASGSLRDRIILSFLDTAPEALMRVRAAVATGSVPDLVRAAHWLKGSALTVGAPRVAASCGGLEFLEPARDWLAVAAAVELVSRELETAMSALRALQAE